MGARNGTDVRCHHYRWRDHGLQHCFPVGPTRSLQLPGWFIQHLFFDLKSKIELIKLLNRLQSKNIDASNVFGTMQSPSLLIEAEKSFKVEFDGEVIITDRAEFSILHKGIRICLN